MKEGYTMTQNEMFSAIQSVFPNATMVRRSNSNFLAVPAEIVDGVQTYRYVKVGALLSKDTENHKAFDFEAAVADYTEYSAKQSEKAATPKKSKGINPEKQAAKEKRKEAALEWLIANVGEHTCTEIKNGLPEVYGEITIMQVGSDMKELAKENPSVKCRTEKAKNFYSFE